MKNIGGASAAGGVAGIVVTGRSIGHKKKLPKGKSPTIRQAAMKSRFLKSTLRTCLLLLLIGCCKPQIIGSVPNTLRPQETDNWCWASTTQMLAQHFGIMVTQCALANHRFTKTNCCDLQNPPATCPKTNDCNTPGWLELDFAGVTFEETETALGWDDVRQQLFCRKKPMGYAYGTPGVVGHVVVVKGYVTVGSTDYVVLNDPWLPCSGNERLLEHSSYADPPGSATHWRTWYNLQKK